MRFGSRSHSTSDEIDPKITTDRDRLVRTLRDLADTIDAAPAASVKAGLAEMATAAGTMVRAVKLALAKR